MDRDGEIELLARGVCVVGQRLLLCHGRRASVTYLPGGHIEFGEPAAAALAREVREEMGRPCRVGRFLGAVEHAFLQKGERRHEVNLVFELALPGLDPAGIPPSAEAKIEFLWVDLANVRRARLEPAVLCDRLESWLAAPGSAAQWATTMG